MFTKNFNRVKSPGVLLRSLIDIARVSSTDDSITVKILEYRETSGARSLSCLDIDIGGVQSR